MKKTSLLTLLVLFILTISAANAAEFSKEEAYNWLSAQSQDGAIEDDVSSTAYAVLAFNNAGVLNKAEESLNWIFSQQSQDYCFPNADCKTKDTSLALVAMNDMVREDNVTQIEAKLKDMMSSTSLGGMWAIEVSPLSTEISGECTISWFISDEEEQKTFTVDNGRFPECGNSYFLDIDECIKSNLLDNYPGITLTVDCLDVEGSKTISLIYKNDNNFYILDSQETDKADLVVNNGCFGLASGDISCRMDPTLYVALAAQRIGSNINNNLYLAEKFDEDNVFQNAILALVKGESVYLENLKTLQKSDGSFNRDVHDTSLAILALKEDSTTYAEEIDAAKEWLMGKQQDDGSLGNAEETALALYAAFSDEAVDVIDSTDSDVECGDGYCNEMAGEDSDVCPEDCAEEEEDTDTEESDVCVVNGKCESEFGENYENCPDDCFCGDGVCDDLEDEEGSCEEDCDFVVEEAVCGDGICEDDENTDNCPEDCEIVTDDDDGSSLGTWIIVLLILLILGGGGYYAYKKGLFTTSKKKPAGGPFSKSGYNFKPRPPVTPSSMKTAKNIPKKSYPKGIGKSAGSKKDDELEKSLDEARKLLKK